MPKWITAFAAAAITFGLLDAAWLSWAVPNLYTPVIGGIMAEDFNLAAAAAFYAIYLAGMCWFCDTPGA